MDALKTFISAMFADDATRWSLVLLIVLPAFDWILGVCRAIADSKFDWASLDIFIRKTIAGRVIPLIALIVLGRFIAVGAPGTLNIPGVDLNLLTGAGIAASVPFLLATITSIVDSAKNEGGPAPTE